MAAEAVKDGWYHFIVDIWITNFNRTEFGIYKRSRNRAKSRQFTSDMDIFAEVIEGGERTGLIGYREELWEKAKEMDVPFLGEIPLNASLRLFADQDVTRYYDLEAFNHLDQARSHIGRQATRYQRGELIRWAITQRANDVWNTR